MRVSQHKLLFRILQCVVLIMILAIYILSGFLSITLQRNAIRRININTPVKILPREMNAGVCSKVHDNSTWFQTDHGELLMNKTIYFCKVPKCGSTFMGMFLRNIFSIKKGENSNSNFKIERNVTISSAYTFMFVREPYGRILSAYQNKLFNPSPLMAKLGTVIIKEVRQNPSKLSLRLGHDVTFTELIQYIVKFYYQSRPINPHVTAMHTLCHPCRQKFDFIGKLETMTINLVQLVKEWKTMGLISEYTKSAEEVESEILNRFAVGPVTHMFQFYNDNKDSISKYNFFQRTWAYYQIRGQILKEYKLPFDESTVNNATIQTYKEVLWVALDVSKKYKSILKAQRREVVQQAYRSVPIKLLEKLSQYLKTDCELFGYEKRPGWIFNNSEWTPLSTHDYFKWL